MSGRDFPWIHFERNDSEDRAGPLKVNTRTMHVRLGSNCWVRTRPTQVIDTRKDERLDVRDKGAVVVGTIALVGVAVAATGLLLQRFVRQ